MHTYQWLRRGRSVELRPCRLVLLNVGERVQATARRSLHVASATAITALIGFVAACSNVKMPVPPELAEVSEEVPITGRSRLAGLPWVDESFRIGSYEITKVDREWTVSGGVSIIGLSRKRVTGGYSYVFRGGKDERKAECVIGAEEKAISPPGLPVSLRRAKAALECVCHGSDGASNMVMPLSYAGKWLLGGSGEDRQGELTIGGWKAIVAGGSSNSGEDHQGKLSIGGHDFRVTVISKAEQRGWNYVAGEGWSNTVVVPLLEPTGCLVDRDGPAGGLELVRPGRAWFARSLDNTEREDMACLFGALLLYDPQGSGL